MSPSLPAILGGAVLALALSSCAASPRDAAAASPPGDPGVASAAACDAGALSWATGQVADEALVERARVQAHATKVRLLRPGMMVTNDVDGSRLNIRVDNDRKVISTSCG